MNGIHWSMAAKSSSSFDSLIAYPSLSVAELSPVLKLASVQTGFHRFEYRYKELPSLFRCSRHLGIVNLPSYEKLGHLITSVVVGLGVDYLTTVF